MCHKIFKSLSQFEGPTPYWKVVLGEKYIVNFRKFESLFYSLDFSIFALNSIAFWDSFEMIQSYCKAFLPDICTFVSIFWSNVQFLVFQLSNKFESTLIWALKLFVHHKYHTVYMTLFISTSNLITEPC